MNAREQGFLLLSSTLGNPERKPLTIPQLRELAKRVQQMPPNNEVRDLTVKDLTGIGYSIDAAQHIICLLSEQQQLQWYLQRANQWDCYPLSRISLSYPALLRKRLGMDAPGCLWLKGNVQLLNLPAISLVGSRDLHEKNRIFAQEVGKQAARQGVTLVSGNARGADLVAQEACLAGGGNVISVIADELHAKPLQHRVLYISEEGFDLPFHKFRALSRNRIIHCLGSITLVAQSSKGIGGTWQGTIQNLKKNWSPVFCCNDQSDASFALSQMGAEWIDAQQLQDFSRLHSGNVSFLG